ncbi:50S ribosomal protein L6 [Candidatus Woesearchaeota archaeon]|jgi:large subunit ribosomal protein L6|nr:50S ribosomal protein L6 [Candidatus Woesearchaeota archaeon]
MRADIKEEIEIPQGVTITVDGTNVIVKGSKGDVTRIFNHPRIHVSSEGNLVFVDSKNASKREKTLMNTYIAHIKNMIKGVTHGHLYKMKICSGHFPMTAAVSGKNFVVKNFLGEKNPRKMQIKDGAKVKVEGDQVIIESTNKEISGQVAADIELLTRVGNRRDIRIFQDGIFIIEKSGKSMLE